MEDRIQELEIRYSLQQDTLLQLSDVIASHEKEIVKLRAQVEELRQTRGSAPLPFVNDETPPHY